MKLSRPKFWKNINAISVLFIPLSIIYYILTAINNIKLRPPVKLSSFVICIGNITVGGTGKTPIAIKIGKLFQKEGFKVAYLTRGFGGKTNHIGLIDNTIHSHHEVGDEAIMLSKTASTYIGKDRSITGALAEKDGAEIIIMDDGMQNSSLHKDITILAFDAQYKFGNGFLLPSGPLRETLNDGFKKADILVCTNVPEETDNLIKHSFPKLMHKPCFTINYITKNASTLNKNKFIILCSIADPEKFIGTAQKAGAIILETILYPDHHNYTAKEIDDAITRANAAGCKILTTSKDAVKMTSSQNEQVVILELELESKDGFFDSILNLSKSKMLNKNAN